MDRTGGLWGHLSKGAVSAKQRSNTRSMAARALYLLLHPGFIATESSARLFTHTCPPDPHHVICAMAACTAAHWWVESGMA